MGKVGPELFDLLGNAALFHCPLLLLSGTFHAVVMLLAATLPSLTFALFPLR
jgi:hypothetical protein